MARGEIALSPSGGLYRADLWFRGLPPGRQTDVAVLRVGLGVALVGLGAVVRLVAGRPRAGAVRARRHHARPSGRGAALGDARGAGRKGECLGGEQKGMGVSEREREIEHIETGFEWRLVVRGVCDHEEKA